MTEETEIRFAEQVGRRLRAIRQQQRLSLEEVENRSGGRWSASAIGAYERGYRNLSLTRLRELATFYGVPMSVLLGEIDLRDTGVDPMPQRIALDLASLDQSPDAAPIARYAQAIAMERGDFNGRVLSIRRDDLRVLASLYQVSERELLDRLASWGVLWLNEGADAMNPRTIRTP
jgi:transcriptional regulator with XRE-family HTH domain